MDRAWLNKTSRAMRIDPEKALQKLRTLEYELACSDLAARVKSLRTNSLKRDRELREACLFCFGMSQRIEQSVWVYPIEESDFDFVAGWEVDDEQHLAPTQLKEVVPKERNSNATLQGVIDGLVKYRTSEQLTVAIHLNQQVKFDPNQIILPSLNLAALWVFGSLARDQSQWFLYGNMLEEATYTTFQYPA